jgi:hypothetical protein
MATRLPKAKRKTADTSNQSESTSVQQAKQQKQSQTPLPALNGEGSTTKRLVIVVLDQATLELGKKEKQYVLLNGEDHAQYLIKGKKDPEQYRPDITHQV